ncbi:MULTISPECIES: hypothetical protein [Rhodococcus]|uniref:hypothetical protein n=1 Tax=Rhodococcus TaxID=1827 RepID=UPI000A6AE059|nr:MULTISPECIES: hypothetical protein [Rhodococcus]MCD2132285.1 hypothetical protein [Rhodococcus qingshengii]MCZ4617828.1 hypothetical protein [Rhodococcus qingshengii]
MPEFDEVPSSLCAEWFQVVAGPGPVEFCGEAGDPGGTLDVDVHAWMLSASVNMTCTWNGRS